MLGNSKKPETPETDREEWIIQNESGLGDMDGDKVVDSSFARRLERERNEALLAMRDLLKMTDLCYHKTPVDGCPACRTMAICEKHKF